MTEEQSKVLTLRPELNEVLMKAAPDILNRAIDTVIRIADEIGAPVVIVAPDEVSEPLAFVSEKAYENRTWMVGALEEAKDDVKYPVSFAPEEGEEAEE